MKVDSELFDDLIKNGIDQWIHHFKVLGIAFKLTESEAEKHAFQNLIDLQGSLVVSEGLQDLSVFEHTLAHIKNRYCKE